MPITQAQAITLQQLSLDAATAEVVGALGDRGIRAILLKGPATARLLYDDPSQRPYSDIDLLVAPDDFTPSEDVLSSLGYENVFEGERPREFRDHESEWKRSGRIPAQVDLHRRLYWSRIEPNAAWALLSADTETMNVGGAMVEVLGRPARALGLAFHALYHGTEIPRPLEDLELAVGRLQPSDWEAAAELAAELGSSDALAAGLRLVPSGHALAQRLDLASSAQPDVVLMAGTRTPTALGFERLREQPTLAARLRFLWVKLWPTPPFLRMWQPVARRGRLGLVAAYVWRPFWLAWMAPRGLRAWLRARRVRTHEPD